MQLSGPSFEPKSVAADSLVIFLHGVGADGNDLIGLAPYFAQALPRTAFVSPNAPYRYEGAPFGYQWFSILTQDPALRLGQLRATAPILDAFIDDELKKRSLDDSRLALVGFSQGTMMSLFVGPRRPKACAAIVGYSGRLEAPQLLKDEIKSRPPALLVHGDADELLPSRLTEQAAATLTEAGMTVEAHIRPGLGHGIDEEGIRLGMAFLKGRLAA
jgi:phospholipase/carboxylesterase